MLKFWYASNFESGLCCQKTVYVMHLMYWHNQDNRNYDIHI